jgi:RHS repeat-associated protein
MLAAKHFDPVIGIDIHIIQPPGPVPPVPIPHPFIGFLMDPADYVPIVGSTVQINGMHRAQAGTAGKCVPPHIPIGGVFVPPPPGNECEMFMGSATVEIDGEAQSYMSLPVLSCQSIGMPSLPRMTPKKKTIPKCLMLPTSQVLPIPAGPPVMIGGPPTISIMGMAMKAGMAGLGKLGKGLRKLQRGGGKIGKAMRKLSKTLRDKAKSLMTKMGVPPSIQNKVSRGICAVTGHPVDIATGKVFTDAVDIELPGPLPLRFERVWFSTSVYQGPLGHGWHHSYDLALTEEEGAVAVRMADGRPLAFPALRNGESYFDRAERMTLHRDRDGYQLTDLTGISYRFGLVTFDTTVQKLLSVSDRPGFRIEFRYDSYGRLEEIIDSAGRRLPVRCDDSGRIVEIRGPHPDKANQTITLVCYDYNTAGDLVKVRDALDQPMKFRYEDHLLVKETDRNGLSFYFEYSRHGDQIRCHHTWGDGGIYNHRLEYDLDLRRTRVTNSLGHTTTHFWNENGLVFKSVDSLGCTKETVYNEFNQPISEINELGKATTWEYDDRGNQILTVNPDEATVAVTYNEFDLPLRAVDTLGNPWEWEYNDRGLLTRRVDGSRRQTLFRYSDRRLMAIIDPANNATEIGYDSTGIPESVKTPDGSLTRWQYDALGRPTSVTTPAGVQRRTYDLLGRIIKIDEPDGNFRSLAYDAVGNVLHAKDLQHDVRFSWQGMGRLASRREAGRTIEFKYNTEEDLTGIVNEHGHVYRFELDPRGELGKEFGFDDIRRIYTRDDAGRVIRVERASGLITQYQYDPAGRVIEVNHSDGSVEKYVYRADGELIEATNNSCTIRFERDPLGRILKEWQGDYWVSSTYNDNGLRTEMRSCFGAIQKIDRNAMGDVIGLQYLDAQADPTKVTWAARIQRDALGLEIERSLPGGIRSRWERDKLGRPIRHQILGGSGTARDVKYQWDVNDRLRSIVDAHHGTTVFDHDELGNLAAATYGDGNVELRMPDAVGNLFRTKDRSDRKYGKAGEILQSRDDKGVTKYEYDAEGNLIRKSTPDGERTYSWNSAGMLQSVSRPDGELVEFEYDPVGRRIRKAFKGQTTRWIWDGNVPLHEWVEGGEEPETTAAPLVPDSSTAPPIYAALTSTPATEPPAAEVDPLLPLPIGVITWLFGPESFTPAAKVVGRERYSIVADYLGTPTTMLNSSGQVVWSANISIYGELRNLTGNRYACPFRWPGQYEDSETGLYYNRFRYFDPSLGQYLNQDPAGLRGGTALYSYVRDTNYWIDPWGLTQCQPDLGPNTLTPKEIQELQALADRYKTNIDVIGSRAAGNGRNIATDLPVGKGPGTRSDIDVRIDGQVDIDTRGGLSNDVGNVGNGAGTVASSTGLPSSPPVIKFRPGKPPERVT